ncbi:Hypothetical predicted protein [Pelobates cultripes]|uniref:Uncharacterized protein n=1 Tax=Pelobates cultripes TaxID=61616 RepID=A0AAD1RND0_PELCU|nr:Hypothetical predicted protein [Pelobates cultripes]
MVWHERNAKAVSSKMVEATCVPKHKEEKPDLLARLDELFNAFWRKLALREQHTKHHKPEEHSPLVLLAHSLHGRALPRTERARTWCRRRQRLPQACKPICCNLLMAKLHRKKTTPTTTLPADPVIHAPALEGRHHSGSETRKKPTSRLCSLQHLHIPKYSPEIWRRRLPTVSSEGPSWSTEP